MLAYIFQADIYCASCAKEIMTGRDKPAHVDPNDESSYDSDEWPKGPYGDGGGEADTPQHCGGCGVFLENPLTPDGDAYVRAKAAPYEYPDDDGDVATWGEIADRAHNDGQAVLAEWFAYYFQWGN